ncbi:MAG: acetyl-CoA synthetase [Alphaproteobacteria bacterium]|jgi:acetyl-CoA synthetase
MWIALRGCFHFPFTLPFGTLQRLEYAGEIVGASQKAQLKIQGRSSMLQYGETYDEVHKRFQWRIPEYYNIGIDVCDKHALTRPNSLAILYYRGEGDPIRYTFGQLRTLSNRLANVFVAKGLKQGDRVGILLPQAPETAIAHIAAYKAGLIAVPLFTLFGQDALAYRLSSSGAKILITGEDSLEKLAG